MKNVSFRGKYISLIVCWWQNIVLR